MRGVAPWVALLVALFLLAMVAALGGEYGVDDFWRAVGA